MHTHTHTHFALLTAKMHMHMHPHTHFASLTAKMTAHTLTHIRFGLIDLENTHTQVHLHNLMASSSSFFVQVYSTEWLNPMCSLLERASTGLCSACEASCTFNV